MIGPEASSTSTTQFDFIHQNRTALISLVKTDLEITGNMGTVEGRLDA